MKYPPTPAADQAAEVICRAWGTKRSRNSNSFVSEPAYAYKITKQVRPIVRKAYVGEIQWTIEAQGFEAEKMFRLSFGEPFQALLAIEPYQRKPRLDGLEVFCFPGESAIEGVDASDREGNAWLISQEEFTTRLKLLRLVKGEMFSIAIRSVFARLKMSEPSAVARRLGVFEEIVAWLQAREPR